MNFDVPVIIIHKSIYTLNVPFYNKLKFKYNVYVYNKNDKDMTIDYHFVKEQSNSILEYTNVQSPKVTSNHYKQEVSNNSLQYKTSCTSTCSSVRVTEILPTSPRLIIWPNDKPLTISGTWVYRCSKTSIPPEEVFSLLDSFKFTKKKSCIIFDLDDTLIRKDNSIIPYSEDLVRLAKYHYDYVILWSHGSKLHVIENVLEFKQLFDQIISRNPDTKNAPKNPFYLYTKIKDILFTSFTLVDDLMENATDGYSDVLVPHTSTDNYYFLRVLQNLNKKKCIVL